MFCSGCFTCFSRPDLAPVATTDDDAFWAQASCRELAEPMGLFSASSPSECREIPSRLVSASHRQLSPLDLPSPRRERPLVSSCLHRAGVQSISSIYRDESLSLRFPPPGRIGPDQDRRKLQQ